MTTPDASTASAPQASAPPAAAPLTPQPTHQRGPYLRAWRALPRDLGYLGLTLLLLPTAYVVLYGLFWGGVGSIAAIVGVFLILGSLFVARWLGEFELRRLQWAQPHGIRPVVWGPGTGSNSFWRAFSALGNPHYWLFLLHGLLLLPVVSIVTLSITFAWLTVSLSLLAVPVVALVAPDVLQVDGQWPEFLGNSPITPLGATALAFALGVGFTALLPVITRGFVLLHFQIARLTLAGFRSEVLQQQVTDLSAARGAAVSAEGHSLRRLERDIHDGPQQRLVRLQMDLSAADRQLDADPAAARELIAGAMEQSREALEELRALSRGFAPPILLDRGLVAALESAAIRSAVPTTVIDQIPPGSVLPQEIERNAYFVASEAMANATKHSQADAIDVTVSIPASVDGGPRSLTIVVRDTGIGGAFATPGHGLAGLDERMRGLGGTLDVASPTGGPTIVTALLPLP